MSKNTGGELNQRVYLCGSAGSRFSISRYHIGSARAACADGPSHPSSGETYMRRWVLHTPWGSLRLHHILRSDHDRDLHCHPMDFWTLLLGEYTEWLPADAPDSVKVLAVQGSLPGLPMPLAIGHRRLRFSLRFVRAETPHRLELDRPVWTIVWAWPKRRKWGFYVGGVDPKHWVDAREYLGGEATP